MEREAFLDRVRTALDRPHPAQALPTSFPHTPASAPDGDLAEAFAAALAATNGIARVVDRADLRAAVADVAREGPPPRAVVAGDVGDLDDDVTAGFMDAGVEVARPLDEQWRTMFEAEPGAVGVTSAVAAVASTGSLLLVPDERAPRLASLFETHLAVVPVERLVPGLEEALALLAQHAPASSAVFVTGPSRTSDIEMTTVYGVHGPRVARVLLVR